MSHECSCFAQYPVVTKYASAEVPATAIAMGTKTTKAMKADLEQYAENHTVCEAMAVREEQLVF